jgi:hypothetical protein
MTEDEIIKLARKAGASNLNGGEWALFGDVAIERFAQLIATAEPNAISLRDYFAAKAMKSYSDDTDELMLDNAIKAYKQADAMLKARGQA